MEYAKSTDSLFYNNSSYNSISPSNAVTRNLNINNTHVTNPANMQANMQANTSNSIIHSKVGPIAIAAANSADQTYSPKLANSSIMPNKQIYSTKYFVAPELLLEHDDASDYTAYNVSWDAEIQNYKYQINGFRYNESYWVTAADLGISSINYFSGPMPVEYRRHISSARSGISCDPKLRNKVMSSITKDYLYRDLIIISLGFAFLGGVVVMLILLL